jgi:hypothetical protein
VDALIEKLGGVDLIEFDNTMSLIEGDHREEEGWRQTLPWVRGPVDGVVGIEGGVVSGVINLESSGVGASDWRPRHGKHYQEV